jgi:pimeloyl-ACP methyl ester carboxylesterase
VRAQVNLVAGFIDKLLGGTCTLFGNSMGGMISALLAAEHPTLVSRLVLVNPALPRVSGVAADPTFTLSMVGYLTPGLGELMMRSRRRWTPRRFLDSTLTLCGVDTNRLDPGILDAMLEGIQYRRTTDWADRAFLQAARSVGAWTALRTGPYRAELVKLRCPTLLIHGTKDRLVPVGFARAVARLCPSWDTEILEGVGHVPQLEVPDRFVEVVTRWLS